MPPSKKLWQVFFVYIFCKLPFKFYVNNKSKKKKKNIRQFNSHRCRQPLSQLSSAVWISRHLSSLSATSLPGFSVEGERKRENPGREVGLSGELVLSRSIPSLLNHLDQARTALGTRLYRRFYSENSSTPACPLFWVKDQNVNDIVDGGWRYSWTPL